MSIRAESTYENSAAKRTPGEFSRHSRGFTLLEVLVVVAILGVLSAIAIQYVHRALDSARTARTMAEMEAVAKAVIQRAAQTNNYPRGRVRVARIANLLGPYMGHVPTQDGWGHDLYYIYSENGEFEESDFEETGDSEHSDPGRENRMGVFRIVSFGKDGIPDGNFVTGVWVDFNSDLVIQEGNFIQSRW